MARILANSSRSIVPGRNMRSPIRTRLDLEMVRPLRGAQQFTGSEEFVFKVVDFSDRGTDRKVSCIWKMSALIRFLAKTPAAAALCWDWMHRDSPSAGWLGDLSEVADSICQAVLSSAALLAVGAPVLESASSNSRTISFSSARLITWLRFFSVSPMYFDEIAERSTRNRGLPSFVAIQLAASVLPVPLGPTSNARTPGR